MEEKIKIVSDCKYKDYVGLHRFYFKNSILNKFVMIIELIIIAMSIVIILYNNNYRYGITLLCIGIFVILVELIYPLVIPKIMFQKPRKIKYEFDSEFIYIENGKNKEIVSYDTLYRVYETKLYFFLYLEKEKVYIIVKRNLENKKIENLRYFFINTLKTRFYIKY